MIIAYSSSPTSSLNEGPDVLSGVIGALLAQGLEPFKAAQMAAWLHASAADEVVAGQGETGLRATELIPVIRRRLNFIIG